MSSQYETLKKCFRKTPYLVVSQGGEMRLATEAECLSSMFEEADSATIVNAKKALERFAAIVGKEDRNFRRPDIGVVMGVGDQMVWFHYKHGVLSPSVRKGVPSADPALYSWGDAFAAGLIGTLKRHGLSPDELANVQPLIQEVLKNRTAQKLATSKQS